MCDVCDEYLIPPGFKKCDHGCGRNVPVGHSLCDWCAAEHIRKQFTPERLINGETDA